MTHHAGNELTPNGHSHISLRSEYITKCKQIADNATERGEHDKASQFIAMAKRHSGVI